MRPMPNRQAAPNILATLREMRRIGHDDSAMK
jgi:hypothetical protein